MKKRIAPLLIGIVIIAVITAAMTGYSGSMTARWGAFRGINEARAAMKTLPMKIEGTVGTWEADEEFELDDLSVTMLQIQNSYLFRSYRNTMTQEVVHLTLMIGPSGRITVHSPDICFGGRDYEKESARARVPVNVQLSSGEEIDNTFWRTDFVGRSLDVNNRISFYYAVSTGGSWLAVENPRQTFRTYRFVYKLQAQAYSGSNEDSDVVRRFLEDCLPTLHEYLSQCY